LSSTIARGLLVLAYVFLFWFNLKFPPPVSIERPTSNLEYLLETARDARAGPPLPLHTAAKIELITRTVIGENLNFNSLWEASDGDPNLEAIVLEEWIESDPEAAMKKAKGTHLNLLSWQLLGEQKGAEAWTKKTFVKKDQSESLLVGIARSDPPFVIRIIEQSKRLETKKISTAIVHGLAQTNILKALNYEFNPRTSDSYRGIDGSFDYYRRLMSWARKSPEEALAWIWERKKRSHWYVSFLTKEIARTDPQLVLNALNQLPTGNTKKAFQKGFEDARKTSHPNEDNPCETGSDRSPARLLSALIVATDSFSDKWPDLLQNAQFNDLPKERKAFIHSIITERWIDYNPQGYAKNKGYRNPECIARWLELDEAGLYQKLESLIGQEDERAFEFFPTIVEVVGRDSMTRAFALFDQFPAMLKDKDPSDFRDVTRKLAARDREAFLATASLHAPWKAEAQAAVIAEWREKDLPWCIVKCLEWDRENLILGLDQETLRRLPLMQNFDNLPANWRDDLLQKIEISESLDLKWLLQPPPKNIGEEALKEIRTDLISWAYWYEPEDFPVAAEVIKKCHFFDPALRSRLAERIIASHDLRDLRELERAEKWLSEIPDEFSKEARVCLERRKEEEEDVSELTSSMEQSAILKVLNLPPSDYRAIESRIRPDSYYAEIQTRISQLPARDCLEFIKSGEYRSLVIEIQKALLENALRIESVRDDSLIRTSAQRMTIEWAEDEPVLAAKWVLALPRGKVRDCCLLKAYIYWSSWDAKEAEDWGGTLSTDDQKVLSLR
jgi:hypothetical protein